MYKCPKPKYLKLFVIILPFWISSLTLGQSFSNLALHSNVDHVQPMNGIVFWTDNLTALNALGNKCQLEFSYMIFSDIVSDPGVYNWSAVDNLLAQTASHGRQAIIRFRYTYPGVTSVSVPAYIRNSSGYEEQILDVEGKPTYIPDWSSQELQDFTLEFFSEFANRYDNDPRLAYLQVGFGSYSEYHLYDGPRVLGQTFPSKSYQTTFLQHLDSVFNTTSWSISIDASQDAYSPIDENTLLKNLDYGLFDDSFLHQNHSESSSEYNRSSWEFFGADRTKTKVAGGEFNYHSTYDQEHVLDLPNGPWGVSFEELATLYKISYIIGNDQFRYQSTERIEDAGLNIGYNFKVNQFRTNGMVTEVEITNTGIAPIYYDAFPTILGIRSSESLKGLSSGESKTFIIDTVASDEQLNIESDRLVAGQEIQFNANLEADPLSTDGIMEEKLIFAFPNPFEDELLIVNKENKTIEVRLYNILGAKVYQKTINGSNKINTSAIDNGVYILRLLERGEINSSAFFVKK